MHKRTLIIGAGAAGLFCAGMSGADTLVIDHAKAAGEKIRISGGGSCNFTNIHASHDNFISQNRHFCKSALSRYTQWDFLDLVERYGIGWHEKTLGQLFCDNSAKDIIQMLLSEMADAELWLQTTVINIEKRDQGFSVRVQKQGREMTITCDHLVIATGGKSIPKMGATGFAYEVAEQFGMDVIEPRAGLVPFTFSDNKFKELSGVATPVRAVAVNGPDFEEALLFTHRGLSGPAVLQVSSYWKEGENLSLNLLPNVDFAKMLQAQRQVAGRKSIGKVLANHLPSRLVEHLSDALPLKENVADQSDTKIFALVDALQNWRVKPTGTEGFRTAEVTLGGIDTDGLSSKTMMSKTVENLYFIGESVDVTGWLGGYNFQWAWSSAYAAGTAIAGAEKPMHK